MSDRTRLNANEDAEIRRDEIQKLLASPGWRKYVAPLLAEEHSRADKELYDQNLSDRDHCNARGRATVIQKLRNHLDLLLKRAEEQAKHD